MREGVGIATNNVAEYRALLLGLNYALQKGYKHIRVQGDSKLVVMQVWITTIEITRHSLIPKCLTFFFLAFPVLFISACGHGYSAASVCLLIWFYFCGLTMYLCYRFKVCGNSKIKTWQTCARWPRSSRIGSCLLRSVMLKG